MTKRAYSARRWHRARARARARREYRNGAQRALRFGICARKPAKITDASAARRALRKTRIISPSLIIFIPRRRRRRHRQIRRRAAARSIKNGALGGGSLKMVTTYRRQHSCGVSAYATNLARGARKISSTKWLGAISVTRHGRQEDRRGGIEQRRIGVAALKNISVASSW